MSQLAHLWKKCQNPISALWARLCIHIIGCLMAKTEMHWTTLSTNATKFIIEIAPQSLHDDNDRNSERLSGACYLQRFHRRFYRSKLFYIRLSRKNYLLAQNLMNMEAHERTEQKSEEWVGHEVRNSQRNTTGIFFNTNVSSFSHFTHDQSFCFQSCSLTFSC